MRRTNLKTVHVKFADELGNRINLLKYDYERYITQVEVIEDTTFGGYFITIWKLGERK